jgi:hypothetical protein
MDRHRLAVTRGDDAAALVRRLGPGVRDDLVEEPA